MRPTTSAESRTCSSTCSSRARRSVAAWARSRRRRRRRRLSQRAHDLRPHELLHGFAFVGVRARPRHPVRCVRHSVIDAAELRERARSDHPGGEAQDRQSAGGGDGDAVRAAARRASNAPVAHWTRGRTSQAHARRSHDFYRNFYRPRTRSSPSSATLIPTKRVRDSRSALRFAEDAPWSAPAGPARARITPTCVTASSTGDIAQTQLVIGWRTPHSHAPRHAGARRRSHDPRRRTCLATLSRRARTSARYVRVGVRLHAYRARNLRRTRRRTAGAHRRRRAQRVGADRRRARARLFNDDELNRARQLLEARWIRRLETMEGQANHLAEWEALGEWRLRRARPRATAHSDGRRGERRSAAPSHGGVRPACSYIARGVRRRSRAMRPRCVRC